jgi:hypothetical protein
LENSKEIKTSPILEEVLHIGRIHQQKGSPLTDQKNKALINKVINDLIIAWVILSR